jgi:hypothetical protein
MNLTLVISRDGMLQKYTLLLIFSVYNTAVLLRRPWRHEGMDAFDGISHVTLIAVVAVAAKFASVNEYVNLFVSYTLLSVSLLVFVCVAGFVAFFLRLQMTEPQRLKHATTFMEELKTIFEVVLKTECLPVVDFQSGVVEKPLAEWLLTIGANDRATLENARTLLVTEFVGHQARRSKSKQRLIAGSHQGDKLWDGTETDISDKHSAVVEHIKRNTNSRLSASDTMRSTVTGVTGSSSASTYRPSRWSMCSAASPPDDEQESVQNTSERLANQDETPYAQV